MSTDPHSPMMGTVDPCAVPLVALLVEDNAADAELISIRLEPDRCGTDGVPVRVVHRSTVAGARAALTYWTVDVVLLDLTLPDARGLEALHRIREAVPGMPVIVVSGIADQELALEALRAGAQDYLIKPAPDGQVLSRILRYAVERQRLMRTIDASLRASAVAARQWKLVAEVSRVLATSSDARTAIPQVANLCVPEVADSFVAFLSGDEEEFGSGQFWHAEGRKSTELKESIESLLDHSESGISRLLDAPHSHNGAGGDSWNNSFQSLYVPLGLASGTAMPLCFSGRVRGVLVLAFLPRRRDPIADIEFTRSVADRIGLALEQNKLLRQMQRAVNARDRALSVVSHDLRNPLSTIRICAAALLDPEPAPPSGIREMGELIQRSTSWMNQIVEDLLDRASLDAGRLVLNRKVTSVAEVFEATRVIFGAIADENAIQFDLSYCADIPFVDADPHRLLQALSNLISNAIKFTPAGGCVQLLAESVENEHIELRRNTHAVTGVQFTVSDTGPGISGGDLSHIFDWYWQSPIGANRGAGLGLAIAKGLIDAHASELNVRSVLGGGTSFWFIIPTVNGVHPPLETAREIVL
jgi:signal transduction histidine kinase/DNA-binding NarL/FixJ family response regulator